MLRAMRLLLDGHLTAAENMRRDELLHAAVVPTVRLYGWKPEAISLGNSQSEADIELEAVREYGLDAVKRGTGGGGILHNATEVTYAVVLPIDHPGLNANITDSFGLLSRGVVHALRSLGLPAELESMPDRTRGARGGGRGRGAGGGGRGRGSAGGARRRAK